MAERPFKSAVQSTKKENGHSDSLKECYLCGKKDKYNMTKYSTWKEKWSTLFILHHLPNNHPPSDAFICKKDLLEVQRHYHDLSYIPKWKQNLKMKNISVCKYPQCTKTNQNTQIIKASFAPEEKLKETMGITEEGEILLCKNHYNEVYRATHFRACASCHAYPKEGRTFSHHSPDPVIVAAYFGDDCEIQPDELLCLMCYRVHLSVLSDIENQPVPINERLQQDIELFQEVHDRESTGKLTRATLVAVIAVAKRFYLEKVMLLTTASAIFLEAYTGDSYFSGVSSVEIYLENGDSKTKFSSHWLLHQLLLHIKDYLCFKCIHKKYGTVLYKRGGDLLTSLS